MREITVTKTITVNITELLDDVLAFIEDNANFEDTTFSELDGKSQLNVIKELGEELIKYAKSC